MATLQAPGEPLALAPVSLPGPSKIGISSELRSLPNIDRSPVFQNSSLPSLAFRTQSLPQIHPHTPPESLSGSPKLKSEGSFCGTSVQSSPLPQIARPYSPASSPVRLPSLSEFVQGVELLARNNPPPVRYSSPQERRRPSKRLFAPGPFPSYLVTGSNELSSPTQATYHGLSPTDSSMMGTPYLDQGYPSPPPESESRRINQKYTVEEGDYIIYAWHDKKMKWTRIEQEFADLFGHVPKRTASGLQAWYYRMNQRIPVWDQEGWLIFDKDEDIDPRCISIKCRESQDRPLGLAERYPERAIQYSWVDAELKVKARDWATKRAIQYHQRRDRRRRREHAQAQNDARARL